MSKLSEQDALYNNDEQNACHSNVIKTHAIDIPNQNRQINATDCDVDRFTNGENRIQAGLSPVDSHGRRGSQVPDFREMSPTYIWSKLSLWIKHE